MKRKRERFSRAYVLAEIDKLIAAIQTQYRFDPSKGWSQVANATTPVVVAYGEFYALSLLAEEFAQ